MMTLRGFCLVLSTVILRHMAVQPTPGPLASGQRASITDGHHELSINLLVGLCVVFCVLAKLMAVVSALRYPTVSMQQAWREFEQRRTIIEWLWLALHAWLLPASGYAMVLADLERSGWPHALSMIAWFVPSIVFIAACEFSATQLELDMAASARPRQRDLPSPAGRWWVRMRWGMMGGLAMCLVPVIFVLATIDVLNWMAPDWSELTRSIVAVCILALGCLTLVPLWLQLWTGAQRLASDSEVRARVEQFCSQLKVAPPQILSVGGQHAWYGAALVGWAPPMRQLWLGRVVIQELSTQELDMVILHELAHLRRYHCWIRLVPVLLCGITLVLALAANDGLMGTSLNWSILSAAGPMANVQAAAAMVCIAGLSGLAIALLSWSSRACEVDADGDACRQASRYCTWAAGRPECAASALRAALVKLNGPAANQRLWSWLHPSIERRLQALEECFPESPRSLPDENHGS